MPIYTDKLPQVVTESKLVTLAELIRLLPETLDYPLDVWVSDRMAKYGQASDYIVLFLPLGVAVTDELRTYFNQINEPLGIGTTIASAEGNNLTVSALKLYNAGRLIIDKETLTYKELPSPVFRPFIITINDLKDRLPSTIEWKNTIWLTGGLVRDGWSGKDADLIVFDGTDELVQNMKGFFTRTLGFRVDVGMKVMPEREPVYLFKLYEDGQLCPLS